mmetsp:Transcript_61533/g.148197  ORF Transcript_61533/g.148197 Transcript_61533/m.148197 type:complete len:409 (+) Transcript_61533:464-1690(+)
MTSGCEMAADSRPPPGSEVATRVTEISSPKVSSTEVPKMMLASSETISEMSVATSLTSLSDMPALPVIVKTTPLASAMGKSRSGDETAASAASTARVGPKPRPMPMRALPAPVITARTSAKSTLMRPGLMTMSARPMTPWRMISSAIRKASSMGTSSGTISSSRSLETTMRMSVCSSKRRMAASACSARTRPSKANGVVTTPIVRQPAARARLATTGAAPEPVPPPMPAVTKTMSASLTTALISAADSRALASPTWGLPPAPSPRAVRPIWMMLPASDWSSACASVLHAMYSMHDSRSTPRSRPATRLSVLPPPPPTPTSLIVHGDSPWGSGSSSTGSPMGMAGKCCASEKPSCSPRSNAELCRSGTTLPAGPCSSACSSAAFSVLGAFRICRWTAGLGAFEFCRNSC